jgi:hypothetical protein
MAYNQTNVNGQATSANSQPVVISSDQSAVPISNASLTTIATNTGAATPAGTNIIGKVGIDQTTPGTTNLVAITANSAINNAQINGVTPLMGNGVTGTGSQRVTIASDNTPHAVKIDQTTVGTTNAVSLAQIGATAIATGNGVSSAGVQRVALVSDQTTNTNPLYTKQQAQTTGGATQYQLISAATTNATSLKASAGTVYGIQVFNTGAAVAFLKMYNKATAPTVGTDTPVKTIGIPAGGGSNLPITDIGADFPTGIAFAITGLNTVADTTAVAASQVTVNIDYK